MGACDFQVIATGTTAQKAFESAVETARMEYGNGGYTGTIAEKNFFKMAQVPQGMTVQEALTTWAGDPYHWAYTDKWGPAGCIYIGGGEFIFFGSASS